MHGATIEIFIPSIFINLYMFWATMGPSSGETSATLVSPDDGPTVTQNTWRLINTQRINCAQIWFYLQEYTEIHSQQNIIFLYLVKTA